MLGDILKIDVINNKYIIYLNKFNINNIKLGKKDELEMSFKKLFKILKQNYNIDISGYYSINVFIDKYYGAIIEIIKEEFEYLDYFDSYDTVAMRIKKYELDFLYQVDDYFLVKDFLNKLSVHTYNDNIYLKIIKKLSIKEFNQLLEMSEIIYNNQNKVKTISKDSF